MVISLPSLHPTPPGLETPLVYVSEACMNINFGALQHKKQTNKQTKTALWRYEFTQFSFSLFILILAPPHGRGGGGHGGYY